MGDRLCGRPWFPAIVRGQLERRASVRLLDDGGGRWTRLLPRWLLVVGEQVNLTGLEGTNERGADAGHDGDESFPGRGVRKAGLITEHTGGSRRSTELGKWRFAQSVRVFTHGRAPATHSFFLLRGSPWCFVFSVIESCLG